MGVGWIKATPEDIAPQYRLGSRKVSVGVRPERNARILKRYLRLVGQDPRTDGGDQGLKSRTRSVDNRITAICGWRVLLPTVAASRGERFEQDRGRLLRALPEDWPGFDSCRGKS